MSSKDRPMDQELDRSFDRALGVYLEEISAPAPSRRFTQRVIASAEADAKLSSRRGFSGFRLLSHRVRLAHAGWIGIAAVFSS